jgi:hypothetical protein
MLKILIDTNILLPLEPTSLNDVESLSHQANEFVQKTQKAKALIYLLDVQKNDINRDKDENRRNLRLLACEKYQLLTNVQMSEFFKGNFELSNLNPHDFVDVSLLNALYCNAVSILVTNDNGIHSKAKKIGLGDRVYRLEDALDFINMQLPIDLKAESLHPIINKEKCYNLDIRDDFFDSLRQDYDGFDDWFQEKCQRGHRDCFVIRNESKIAGLCIYKNEEPSYEMKGKIVKICTFKLKYSGTKQGELLLRQLFKMCYDSNVDWLYVTAFESNYICQFFEDFGFEIEEFGGDSFAVRGIPADFTESNPQEMLLEILDSILEDSFKKTPESIKDRIATMSCKAAVKGNNRLSTTEALALIKKLMNLENPYNCPHGRPTMISMSKYELEKKFKRII